jgi:hypothetical protein
MANQDVISALEEMEDDDGKINILFALISLDDDMTVSTRSGSGSGSGNGSESESKNISFALQY